MTTTTNLGLTTYSVAAGSAVTFQTFRSALGGTSSNMTIIDNWVGSASGSIISLSANTIIDVNASQISSNYYEASVSLISSYTTNLKINLKTNAANTGATTIKINSLSIVTLKKVNSSGTLVDLASGDIVSGAYNLFIFNGTYFVLIGSLTTSSGSMTVSGSYVGISPIVVTGSQISLAASGVVSGSYNQVLVDTFGRVTAGSVVASSGTTYTGSAIITVSGSKISHNTSGISSGSYNQILVDPYGHIIAGSVVATGGLSTITGSTIMSDTTGSIVKHNISAVVPNTYLAANITVDQWGHITSAANGTSASSIGAPSNSPFITSGSSTSLTNYGILTAGSNISITPAGANGGNIYINSIGGGSNDGWISSASLTYINSDSPAYTVTCSGDQTAVLYPGMRIKLTDSTVKYFIITSASYSSNTNLTLYGGTDYSLSGSPISNPYYSNVKIPSGFPLNPEKWMVSINSSSSGSQGSPTNGTWYQPGSLQITVPIGIWKLGYSGVMYADRTSGAITMDMALSTSASAISDENLHSYTRVNSATEYMAMLSETSDVTISSKSIYKLIGKIEYTGATTMIFAGNNRPTILFAKSLYI